MKQTFLGTSSVLAVLLALLGHSVSAAPQQYVAPGLTETLASSSQSYLIGVISFVLFTVCIVLAVTSLTGIDYSNDSLLTVDVEPSAHEE